MTRKIGAEELGKMPVEDRKRTVNRLHISYPQIKDVLTEIENCRQHVRLGGEAEGLLITGERGAGKTTLCESYERAFPRKNTEEGTIVPVLFATVQVPATPKSLVTELLLRLGDPAAEKGTVSSGTNRLKRGLERCHTELMILDEFQHFEDRDSSKILKTISDWLKVLMESSRVPIVLVGMPNSSTVLDAAGNEQLRRRFATRLSLDPFEFKSANEQKRFSRFLKEVDYGLPLLEWSDLSTPEMALRIYTATDGVIAYVMKLIRRATVLAIDLAMTKLTLDLLVIAYDQRLASNYPERENPFLTDLPDLKRSRPQSLLAPPQKATNNRSKARPRTLKASEIL